MGKGRESERTTQGGIRRDTGDKMMEEVGAHIEALPM